MRQVCVRMRNDNGAYAPSLFSLRSYHSLAPVGARRSSRNRFNHHGVQFAQFNSIIYNDKVYIYTDVVVYG